MGWLMIYLVWVTWSLGFAWETSLTCALLSKLGLLGLESSILWYIAGSAIVRDLDRTGWAEVARRFHAAATSWPWVLGSLLLIFAGYLAFTEDDDYPKEDL